MTENYKKALELISGNDELKSKIETATKDCSSAEEIIGRMNPVLEEYGITLSSDDIGPCDASGLELSEDELEAVAGGKFKLFYDVPLMPDRFASDCYCVGGGGGTADEYQNTCACVIGGVGTLTEYGKERAAQESIDLPICSKKTPVAMYCPFVGK